MNACFAHVNLVAKDWRRLASFYQQVLGCEQVPPERHLEGDWLSRATGVPEAALEGIHLRLPGWGELGPTLEVFQYSEVLDSPAPAANRRGFAHVAFEVNDVDEALVRVCRHGGDAIGRVLSRSIEGTGTITFAYANDPEGNIIELQHWERGHERDNVPESATDSPLRS